MDPLRWQYKIQAYVEETGSQARSRGFSVIYLEGQSRTGQIYPLNQVEIKGGDFDSDVRVVVGPQVTQIYFSIKEIPSMEGLEYILDNLEKVEQILNEVVIFAPNEIARFNREIKRPVMSIGMLKAQYMVKEGVNRALGMFYELILKEISYANISLAQGKIVPLKRLDVILSELIKIQRGLIQRAKEQGNEKAEKYEHEFNEMILHSKRFEAELASAKSPADIKKIIEKYSSKLFGFSD